MKASEFCYWLQGYFELTGEHTSAVTLDSRQVDTIKRHLSLVFVHDLDPQQVADKLQEIHDGNDPSTSMSPQFGGIGPDGQVYRC